MEGLVLLLSGLIELFVVVIPLILEAAALLVGLVAEIAAGLVSIGIEALFRRSQTPRPEAPNAGDTTPSPRRSAPVIPWPSIKTWSRRLSVASGGLLLITSAALLIANIFFFGPIVRWSLRGLEPRHGVAVTFESADGNLLTGDVHLRNAHIVRADHPVAEFDITIDDLQTDIHLAALWHRRLEFASVMARGIRGDYSRTGPQPDQLPRRGYVAERLEITDAQLTWHDVTRPDRPIAVDIEVDSLESTPFRSQWAAFDVLFRTNAVGRIAGGPFQIATRSIPEGRETRWSAHDLPVTLGAAYVGGPLTWITEGMLDVDVVDHWSLPDDSLDIDMDWKFRLKDIQAETPPDLSAPTRTVVGPIVKYMNEHPRELPLEFSVTISKEEFTGRMSPPLEFMTHVLAEAATQELAERFETTKEAIRDKGRKAWDGAKEFLERRRDAAPRE